MRRYKMPLPGYKLRNLLFIRNGLMGLMILHQELTDLGSYVTRPEEIFAWPPAYRTTRILPEHRNASFRF